MGRIRTGFVKRTVDELLEKHKARFTKDFEKNKKITNEVAEVRTKKLRNMIAGLVTKRLKTAKEISLS